MPKSIHLTPALTAEYQQLFASCTVRPQHQTAVESLVKQLIRQRQRYIKVEHATQVPWAIIAVIHAMESRQGFDRHLHNGDPLHSRTVQVPANRPLSTPPFTWETSAIDALHYSGLAQWKNWSIAGALFKLEAYNGWGYRRYHTQVLSPYLWSFSEHYQAGKYAADGRFDANLVSQQCGAAVLLKQLGPYAPIQPSISSGSTIQLTHPYPDYSIKRSTQQRAVVQHIQRRLNTLGHQPALTTDGYFGPKTQQAVKWFQMSYTGGRLLKIDGIIGAKTWEALFKN